MITRASQISISIARMLADAATRGGTADGFTEALSVGTMRRRHTSFVAAAPKHDGFAPHVRGNAAGANPFRHLSRVAAPGIDGTADPNLPP